MRKKIFIKAVALVACLAILSLSVPGAVSTERNAKKLDFKLLIKKPAIMFYSMLTFLTPIYDTGKNNTSSDQTLNDNSDSGQIIKITGGLLLPKISNQD